MGLCNFQQKGARIIPAPDYLCLALINRHLQHQPDASGRGGRDRQAQKPDPPQGSTTPRSIAVQAK